MAVNGHTETRLLLNRSYWSDWSVLRSSLINTGEMASERLLFWETWSVYLCVSVYLQRIQQENKPGEQDNRRRKNKKLKPRWQKGLINCNGCGFIWSQKAIIGQSLPGVEFWRSLTWSGSLPITKTYCTLKRNMNSGTDATCIMKICNWLVTPLRVIYL